MANQKKFNCSTWTKGTKGKTKTVSLDTPQQAIAYVSEYISYMDAGIVTKIEVYYSNKK